MSWGANEGLELTERQCGKAGERRVADMRWSGRRERGQALGVDRGVRTRRMRNGKRLTRHQCVNWQRFGEGWRRVNGCGTPGGAPRIRTRTQRVRLTWNFVGRRRCVVLEVPARRLRKAFTRGDLARKRPCPALRMRLPPVVDGECDVGSGPGARPSHSPARRHKRGAPGTTLRRSGQTTRKAARLPDTANGRLVGRARTAGRRVGDPEGAHRARPSARPVGRTPRSPTAARRGPRPRRR